MAIKSVDVVLVRLPYKPRAFWLLSKVLELIVAFDSIDRSVKVKMADNREVFHSIRLLYSLVLNVLQSGSHVHSLDTKCADVSEEGGVGIDYGAGRGSSLVPQTEDYLSTGPRLSARPRPLPDAARSQRRGLRDLVGRGQL